MIWLKVGGMAIGLWAFQILFREKDVKRLEKIGVREKVFGTIE